MTTKKTMAKIVLGTALTAGTIAMSGCAASKCGGSKCGSKKADASNMTKTLKIQNS